MAFARRSHSALQSGTVARSRTSPCLRKRIAPRSPVSVVAIQVDLSTPERAKSWRTTFKRRHPIELLLTTPALVCARNSAPILCPGNGDAPAQQPAIVELTYSLLPGMLERGQKGS